MHTYTHRHPHPTPHTYVVNVTPVYREDQQALLDLVVAGDRDVGACDRKLPNRSAQLRIIHHEVARAPTHKVALRKAKTQRNQPKSQRAELGSGAQDDAPL